MEKKIPLLSELVDMYKKGEIVPEDPDSATFSAYLTEYHREHDILMHTHYYFLRRLADLPPTILIRRKYDVAFVRPYDEWNLDIIKPGQRDLK